MSKLTENTTIRTADGDTSRTDDWFAGPGKLLPRTAMEAKDAAVALR